jgi:hypothetical protein
MADRKKKKSERPVFDSIRKPTAPPGRRIGEEKPLERAHPAGRESKHKKKIKPGTRDGNIFEE